MNRYEGDRDPDAEYISPEQDPSQTAPAGSSELGTIHGRVTRAGVAVADAAITIVTGAGPAPDIAPLSDAEGWFELFGLPSGTWRIRAIAPSGESSVASVYVRPGATEEVEIEIGPLSAL